MAKTKVTQEEIADRSSAVDLITYRVRIHGLVALMMHNGQLSDALNPYAQQLKAVSAKRNKTEADIEAMGRIEMEGGLWLDENRKVVIIGEAVESMLQGAASLRKLKKAFKAAVFAAEAYYPLKHDGPSTVDALLKSPQHCDRRRVKVKESAVWRVRPIFRGWSAEVTVQLINDCGVTEQDLREAFVAAGLRIGLGDYRPKFGRFRVESFERVKA